MTTEEAIDFRKCLCDFLDDFVDGNSLLKNRDLVIRGLVNKAEKGDVPAAKLIYQITQDGDAKMAAGTDDIKVCFDDSSEGIRYEE